LNKQFRTAWGSNPADQSRGRILILHISLLFIQPETQQYWNVNNVIDYVHM